MMDSGYPVILVDSYIQGIASFLESINQEVVIMFDEFDKKIGSGRARDNKYQERIGKKYQWIALYEILAGNSGGRCCGRCL